MKNELLKAGDEARRAVVGDERVDGLLKNTTEFDHDFQALVTEYCWGKVWTEGVLDRKQHSLNNICILAALNRSAELTLHLRGAVRNGCTAEEIRDTLIQVTVYCGVPAGVEAFRIARTVLAEEGVDLPAKPLTIA
ncbi:carboxymuconolactone decarboxylase family protein [Paralimibaculum aggregatum]|uniref:Carboxymuconolactone decarboxylase family protein n=1 Tax=Paralimibaculum aggregatum TaxID=3036245 RepID=A0ABQ6LSX9_9RHOB|nr:carboxymuconolactone decarboxylase family protein [Limibaculum sp. NKW23]GMG85174.1 carboxymuconolactone decarboxylase family protein [Limibaculum sp. NKW23]